MAKSKPSANKLDISCAVWTKATDRPNVADAVEIAFLDEYILVRNSAEPDGAVLVFTQAEWDAFTAGVRDGEFDHVD